MIFKKTIAFIFSIIMLIGLCACTETATETESELNTSEMIETTGTPDLSIPTDSSLADSIFDDASDPTKPAGGNAPEEEKTDKPADSTDPSTEATAPDVAPDEMTYEAFIELTPEEQRLYQESFGDLEKFFEWFNAVKEKYENENQPIEITGPIDLGQY